MPSGGSSQPKDQTQVFHIADGFFTIWATREAQEYWSGYPMPSPGALHNPGIELGSPALQKLPDPGIELGSPALQADYLPAELPRKPLKGLYIRPK